MEQIDEAVGLARFDQSGGEEGAQLFGSDATGQMAAMRVRNGTGLFRDDYDKGIGFLGQTDGGAVACAEGGIQIFTLSERENAGGVGDAISLDDDAAIVDGIVGEKDGFEHFRSCLAIHDDSGFGGLLKLNGLLDGDKGADADFRETFYGLNDDFDGFALFLDGVEKGMGAKLSENFAKFGLENNEDGNGGKSDERAKYPAQNLELENERESGEREQEKDKAIDDRGAAGATDELETKVEADRENHDLQDGPPTVVNDVNYVRHRFAVSPKLRLPAPPDRWAQRHGIG